MPQAFFSGNLVPSCYSCNQKKKHFRSDCECARCMAAWAVLGPLVGVYVPMVSMLASDDEVDYDVRCDPDGPGT